MVYKKKKQKFAILVDEYGRNKPQLRELIKLLNDDYSFLKQAANVVTRKRLTTAKKGDYIVFGLSNKYDFRVMNEDQFEEWAAHRHFPEVELYDEWEEMEDLLQQYAEANYPTEWEKTDYDFYYPNSNVRTIVIEDFDPDDYHYVIADTSPRRKSSAKKRKTTVKKNTLDLEQMSVYSYFVKVGYDTYPIELNNQDDEFVKINGNTYWIDRDSNGYGKVSVK